MSRGLRNNNPGNIRHDGRRWQGERLPSRDAAFKQFDSIEWGYRAIFVILDTYRHKHGLRTLRGIIGRYAPPSENDTDAYVRTVATLARIPHPDAPLDFADADRMQALVAAMSRVENGVPANPAEVSGGWQLFCTNAHSGRRAAVSPQSDE